MQEKKKFSKSEVYQLFDAVAGDVQGRYNMLLGQLLTTVEATIEGERQARALKQRMKTIQSSVFEDLNQALWGYHNYMSEKDEMDSIGILQEQMQKIITSYIGNYEGRLVNLVGAVVSDHRLSCLTREIRTLVSITAGYMRNAVPEEANVIKKQEA